MKVFIAGPRAITKFDKRVEERLNNIYSMYMNVIVGDAAELIMDKTGRLVL